MHEHNNLKNPHIPMHGDKKNEKNHLTKHIRLKIIALDYSIRDELGVI